MWQTDSRWHTPGWPLWSPPILSGPHYFLDPTFCLSPLLCSLYSSYTGFLAVPSTLLPQDLCTGCCLFLNCSLYIPMTNFLTSFMSFFKSHLMEAILTTPFKTSTDPLPLALPPIPDLPYPAWLSCFPIPLLRNSMKDFEMGKMFCLVHAYKLYHLSLSVSYAHYRILILMQMILIYQNANCVW